MAVVCSLMVHMSKVSFGCLAVLSMTLPIGSGTYQQRLDSDTALNACVATVGQPEVAALMMAGVRVGGSPYLPTKFRWGYGWSYPRLYRPLSEAELKQVEKLKPELDKISID